MSQDNQKRIEVLEITDSKTGRASGIAIAIPKRPELDALMQGGDAIAIDAKSQLGAEILNAVFGKGHKFNETIGHTVHAMPMKEEQVEALLARMTSAREPRPAHTNLKNRILGRHPILDLLTSPALMHLQALGRGQSKPHPMDALLAELMGDVGCGECTACGGGIDTSSTTLEIAGQLLEGSQILNLGLEAGAVEDLNEEQKALVLDRLKNIRKNLKSFIKALEE